MRPAMGATYNRCCFEVYFNSCAHCGRNSYDNRNDAEIGQFQFMHSVGSATATSIFTAGVNTVSIHAPRDGRNMSKKFY